MARLLRRLQLAWGHDLRLGTVIERLAAVHGGRLVATEEDEAGSRTSLTYDGADALVERWAAGIATRLAPGERLVVALPNGYRFLLACLAASRAGVIPVPVNPGMSDDEIDHVVADAGAAWVVGDIGELDEAALGASPVLRATRSRPDDVAAIFYTSGTTGKPKGARLTQRAMVGQLGPTALWPSLIRRDVAVVGLPVAHIMGFATLLGLAAAGIEVHLLSRFDAGAALDAIESRRASVFIGVPAMYRMLLDAGAEERDLSSVRVWGSGADVMPPDVARRFQRMGGSISIPFVGTTLGPAAFVEGYGMVELGGGAAFRVVVPGIDRLFGDSIGRALPGFRFKVVDDKGRSAPRGAVGELLVKGPGVLEGYHDDDDATAEALTPDGWFRTGDLARLGPFGLVSFAGRKKDVIKRGGFSVFAVEVEASLEEHPDVVEAAVIGLPDERAGEVPAAAVRLRPGASVSGDELVDWARERMSGYKAPVAVAVVDDFPRTGTTKVQKGELRHLF